MLRTNKITKCRTIDEIAGNENVMMLKKLDHEADEIHKESTVGMRGMEGCRKRLEN
jgi:hypothetical protein